MAQYTLSPIFQPQYVPNVAAGLVFAPASAAGLSVVPANWGYQINTCRVSNNANSICTLEVWRVPKGSVNDAQHIRLFFINIPPPTQSNGWFDVGPLFGAVLMSGDAIWMLAGTASQLVVDADGAVFSL